MLYVTRSCHARCHNDLKDKATFQVLFIVSLRAWNITSVGSTVAFTYLKVKYLFTSGGLGVVFFLVLILRIWSFFIAVAVSC